MMRRDLEIGFKQIFSFFRIKCSQIVQKLRIFIQLSVKEPECVNWSSWVVTYTPRRSKRTVVKYKRRRSSSLSSKSMSTRRTPSTCCGKKSAFTSDWHAAGYSWPIAWLTWEEKSLMVFLSVRKVSSSPELIWTVARRSSAEMMTGKVLLQSPKRSLRMVTKT